MILSSRGQRFGTACIFGLVEKTDKENGRVISISKVGRLESEPEWEDG